MSKERDTMNTKDKFPAWCGMDLVKDGDCSPVMKTHKGWLQYADRRGRLMNKLGGKHVLRWRPTVIFIESRNAFRINFCSQPFNINTGR
jgi:hypothetical protein